MIVIGVDTRNINVVLDNLQCKLLVELLKQVPQEDSPSYINLLVSTSEEVNKGGFSTLATDVEAARVSFISVLGFYTGRMVRELPAETVAESSPEDTGESTQPTPPEAKAN